MRKRRVFNKLSYYINIVGVILVTSLFFVGFIPNYDLVGKDLFLTTIVGVLLIFHGITLTKARFILTTFDLFFLIFIGYNVINFFLLSPADIRYTALWIRLCYPIIIYLFLLSPGHRIKNKSIRNIPLTVIVIIGFIQSIYGILQYFEYAEPNNLHFPFTGSFTSPNFLGAFISMCFIILLFSDFKKKKDYNLWRILQIIGLIFLGTVVLITESRAAMLGILIGGIIYIITRYEQYSFYKDLVLKNKIVLFILGVISTIFLGKYLYGFNEGSVNGRIFIAKITTNQIFEKPLFGNGLFSFSAVYNYAKTQYFNSEIRSWEEIQCGNYVEAAFNDYLELTLETGLIGLFMFIGLFALLVRTVKLNSTTAMAYALLLALIVIALFSSVLRAPSLVLIGLWSLSILITNAKFKILTKSTNPPFLKLIRIVVILFGISILFLTVNRIITRIRFEDFSNKSSVNKRLNQEQLKKMYLPMEDHGYSQFYLGVDLLDAGYKKEGLRFMEEAVSKTADPKMIEQLAYTYQEFGNYRRALELFRINVGNEPFRFAPKVNLMHALNEQLRYDQADSIASVILNARIKIPNTIISEYKETARKLIERPQLTPKECISLNGILSYQQSIYAPSLSKLVNYRVYLPPEKGTDKPLRELYILSDMGSENYKIKQFVKAIDQLIESDTLDPFIIILVYPDYIENIDSKTILNTDIVTETVYFLTANLFKEIARKYSTNNNPKTRFMIATKNTSQFLKLLSTKMRSSANLCINPETPCNSIITKLKPILD